MKTNDFVQARAKLILIYLLIIGSVIVLFSFLVIREANDSQGSAAVAFEDGLTLTADEVRKEAYLLMPGREETGAEYEIEGGALYFTVEFGKDDVKGNLVSGEITVAKEGAKNIIEMLTDDFDETVVWIGLMVFLLAALLSIYVAHRTLSPIAENMRRQRQFVSGAAHELRNPLAALHARIESTLRSGDYGPCEEVLTDLLHETKRLISLTEDLLAIEKVGNVARIVEQEEVGAAIARVSKQLALLAHEKRVTFETNATSDRLRISREDLETVLFNLMHNAMKFSREGACVRVSWTRGTLVVADAGIGIAANDLPSIFDRFYRADAARGVDGNGLGLALVRDIIARYGGRIEVESAPEKGATFTVTFP